MQPQKLFCYRGGASPEAHQGSGAATCTSCHWRGSHTQRPAACRLHQTLHLQVLPCIALLTLPHPPSPSLTLAHPPQPPRCDAVFVVGVCDAVHLFENHAC